MATRSRTTFKKRQKELARMEWQRDKAAKRMERKLIRKHAGETSDEASAGLDSEDLPPEETSDTEE